MARRSRLFLGLFVVAIPACSAVSMGVEGPSDEACGTLTYENFASEFFDEYCLRCHSQSLSGFARNSAPADVNFNTLDLVDQHLDRIAVRAGTVGSMPPSAPFPSAQERAQLLNWIDCGALTDEEAANLNDNEASP